MLHGPGATGQALTFSELHRSTRRIGSFLAESLPQQSRILILLPQDLSFVKAYLSCLVAGMVAVPVYLPHNGKQVKKVLGIFADARPHAILWSESSTPRLRSDLKAYGACEGALWMDIDAAGGAREGAAPDAGPDHLAMLQYTSGSTGNPKGVMLTHRHLLANQEMIRETFGHTRESIVVASLPMYHDMGLIGNILQPLYVGATCFLLSPQEVVRQPLSWLHSISTHRATTSGGPNAYYDLCVDRIGPSAGLDELDLSCWNVAFNGAEPIRASTIDTFSEKFARHGFQRSAFLPVYGLAEASLLVTGRRKAPLPRIASVDRTEYERSRIVDQTEPGERPPVKIVGCGLPAHGVEIVIRGSEGRHLGEREVGEILVSGDGVAKGYWQSTSDDLFEVKPDAGGHETRFLRTGDLGFVSEGELFVTGRIKECIIVRGRNYYPADLESTAAQACESVAGGRNAAFSVDIEGREEIVVVQEVARDKDFDHDTVRRDITLQCWMEHGIHLYDIVPVRTGTIPRTTSGKTRRLLVKQLYTAGELPTLDTADADAGNDRRRPSGQDDAPRDAAMREVDLASLPTCLVDMFRGYFPGLRDAIDAHTSMSALGLDSYSLVRFSDEIGQRLGVEVPLTELVKRSTIADVAGYMAEHRRTFTPRSAVAPRLAVDRAGLRTRQTHGQIALWNRAKTAVHAPALTVSRAVRLSTRLAPDVFQAAVTRLVNDHDILRTELKEENGEFFQVIAVDRRPSIEYVDATDWDDARVGRYLEEKANAVLHAERGELWRWFLLSRPAGSVILFTFHHIICDLETINILIEAVFRACATSVADGVEPAASYAEYVERQYEFLESDAGRRSGRLWSQVLEHVDLKLDIVRRKGRPSRVGAGFRELRLDPSSTAMLQRKSAEAHVGLNVLLLAAFAVTLKRYTQQETFAIGVPISARTHHPFRRTLGYMVNVLPVVVDFGAARHFEQVVEQIRERTLLALEHQQYPLSLIIQQYRREHPELVHDLDVLNVVFVYHKASLADGQDATAFAVNTESDEPAIIEGLALCPLTVRARGVEFPVKMTAGVVGRSVAVQLQWDDGVMYESVMSSILDDYDGLLRNVAASHDLRDLPIR
jgi:acyl-CoA synthetase (AMP-forming)/AMP-acid ligase II/acyl carrier protein